MKTGKSDPRNPIPAVGSSSGNDNEVRFPFLFGTQYYRAPTPEPELWQADINGHTIEPYAVDHRSIGGHPGPCYRHPGALAARERFVAVAVQHFRNHSALHM